MLQRGSPQARLLFCIPGVSRLTPCLNCATGCFISVCISSPGAVKCLFEAFDKMRTHEEVLEQQDKVVLAMPPGRYGKLRLQPQQQPRARRQRAAAQA